MNDVFQFRQIEILYAVAVFRPFVVTAFQFRDNRFVFAHRLTDDKGNGIFKRFRNRFSAVNFSDTRMTGIIF